uniref:Uncharacterized protein n=1 Tax=Oryza brachyantha TaxID=4533 RepID=J3MJQ4_ORYBR
MALSFPVRRRAPELIAPAAPTPRETKRLSDLDDQETLRWQVPTVFVYRAGRADPVDTIRRALAAALVPYYPFAGRLREVEDRKLVVDCTGEGVLFIEADADLLVADLEAAGLRAPFPCMDQLLFDVEGSAGVLGTPLLLIQVTRLLCGGFVLGIRLNHVMCDASGIVQFMDAVADLARGGCEPAVSSVWCRELLDARKPPKPEFRLPEYDDVAVTPAPAVALGDMLMRTFSFSAADVAALKGALPPHLRGRGNRATTFEVLAAFIWRARSKALPIPAGEDARLAIVISFKNNGELRLPPGYYGNAALPVTVTTPAEALRRSSLGDVVELLREAKKTMTTEYVRSVADTLVLRGRPPLAMANLLLLSDVRLVGFHRVDFGWGEPVYGGPSHAWFGVSYMIAVKNGTGEHAVAGPVVLPRAAMGVFRSEREPRQNSQRAHFRSLQTSRI